MNTKSVIGMSAFGLALVAMVIFPVIALGLVGSISADAQACGTENIPASNTGTGKPDAGGPPDKFIPIYQAAAAKYKLGSKGPSVLASIHHEETTFGDSNGSGQTSSAGAQGPMQFIPSTWDTYGTDGNGDKKADINNVDDAIFSAARYLRASGAPKDWHSAILSYNHAEWYYNEVWQYANKHNVPATGNATLDDSSAECSPSGSVGGVPGLPDINDIPIKPAGPDGYTQLPPSKYYEFASPNKTGQETLVKLIAATSKAWKQAHPQDTVYVGDLNASNHLSHQCGQDVDIWTTTAGDINLPGYSNKNSIEYGDLWFSTKKIEYIFFNVPEVQAGVNSYAKKNNFPGLMMTQEGHYDHFHVRVHDDAKKCPAGNQYSG